MGPTHAATMGRQDLDRRPRSVPGGGSTRARRRHSRRSRDALGPGIRPTHTASQRLASRPWAGSTTERPTLRGSAPSYAEPKASAPGPGGIPYSAWRNAGCPAHPLLARITLEAATTARLPASLTRSVSVCLPKGTHPSDSAKADAATAQRPKHDLWHSRTPH